jgi:hypothetical protein
MTKPSLCEAGQQLRREINALWPGRDKTSDGWISSAAHRAANPNSDHDPDAQGIVRALDIDRDLDLKHKDASWALAEQLRKKALKGEVRIAYIIHRAQICSPRRNAAGKKWQWRRYTGLNPHYSHLHVSFTKAGDKDKTPFGVTKP